MKEKNVVCEESINRLRNELHLLIEHEKLSSQIVQEMSQELDALILLYYGKDKERRI